MAKVDYSLQLVQYHKDCFGTASILGYVEIRFTVRAKIKEF